MKKTLFVCFLLLFSLSVFATEKFASPYDLIAHWNQNGYPANIGEPYYDNELGKVVFPVVWGEESDVLELLEDPDKAAVVKGDYTHNELYQIRGEIQELFASDPEYGIISVSVGYGFYGGFGENGKMSRVVVTLKERHFALTSSFLKERYGGCVVCETEEGAVPISDPPKTKTLRLVSMDGALKWVMLVSITPAVSALAGFYIWLNRARGKHGINKSGRARQNERHTV